MPRGVLTRDGLRISHGGQLVPHRPSADGGAFGGIADICRARRFHTVLGGGTDSAADTPPVPGRGQCGLRREGGSVSKV